MSALAVIKSAVVGLPRAAKSVAIISGLALKKNAPKILLISGVALTVGGTVVACKKTLKMPEIIKELEEKSNEIHEAVGKTEVVSPVSSESRPYSVEDAKADLTKLYISTGGKILKVYWLPVLMEIGGIALIGISHGIMNKRLEAAEKKLVAAVTAYEGLSQLFEQYRKRIEEAEGVEKEQEYYVKAKENCDIHHVVSENVQKLHEKLSNVNPNNPHMRIYDEVSSRFWSPVPIYNLCKVKEAKSLAWLRMKNRYNDLGYGFIFLWEVELELGLVPTAASFTDGWLYNPKLGEEQISFGLEKGGIGYENKVSFLNGRSCDVSLEFNCTKISDILSDSMLTDTYMERMNY